jgi:hypothetical protein
MLRVYTRMIKILQRRIDVTVDAALSHGATYGDVAAACGVSRQAARQRLLRRTQRQEERSPVPMLNRPLYRDWGPVPADPAVRHASPVASGLAVPPQDTQQGGSTGRKVRVYELAKEFGVESKIVMARLVSMGEFVRSAASTVEMPAVRKLREEFLRQGATGSPSQEDG